jgi:hypothetical protein
MAVTTRPRRKTIHSTSPGRAPSAMRTPISPVRSMTLCAMML